MAYALNVHSLDSYMNLATGMVCGVWKLTVVTSEIVLVIVVF